MPHAESRCRIDRRRSRPGRGRGSGGARAQDGLAEDPLRPRARDRPEPHRLLLDKADLEVVEAGITDGILKTKPKADLETWGPKIQELATARASTAAVAEKKASQAFLDKIAAEQGAVKTASGLIMSTLKPGDGASPAASDKVKVHYEGKLIDGTVFDSSVKRGEPLTIGLGSIIKCWSEGLPMMKVGGKSRLVCPSDLAYGDQGRPPTIKPGATLVFEIELLEIVK